MLRPSLLLALVVLVGCGGSNQQPVNRTPRNNPPPPPPPPPIVVNIADNDATELKPQKFVDYHFPLPARTCSITGRVEGISGGNKDFEAFILDDDDFRNWSAHEKANGIQSGRKVVWTINETVTGPGQWHLVVSNGFSGFTTKAVMVSAKAVCPAT